MRFKVELLNLFWSPMQTNFMSGIKTCTLRDKSSNKQHLKAHPTGMQHVCTPANQAYPIKRVAFSARPSFSLNLFAR